MDPQDGGLVDLEDTNDVLKHGAAARIRKYEKETPKKSKHLLNISATRSKTFPGDIGQEPYSTLDISTGIHPMMGFQPLLQPNNLIAFEKDATNAQDHNPANGEPQYDLKKPFRPGSEHDIFRQSHYFQESRERKFDAPIACFEISPEVSQQLVPPKWPGGNSVCRETLAAMHQDPHNVIMWSNQIPHGELTRPQLYASSAILNREGKTSGELKDWQPHGYQNCADGSTSPTILPTTTTRISPEILCAAYMNIPMNRARIDEQVQVSKNSKDGKSASDWNFTILVSLGCIPVFNVSLGAIVGKSFKTLNKEVTDKINSCYRAVVKRILNELTMASKEELSNFDVTHMSWYLLSPWCLVFTSLRDLLARGEAELNSAEVDKSREEANKTKEAHEDQLEVSSEQLLHRFMEVILLLFSILCNSRDDFRSTPGHAKEPITIGSKPCMFEDDGYIYVGRAGTSKKDGISSNHNRFGEIPVLRYEAKRLSVKSTTEKNITAQIFSELLGAAIMNLNHLKKTDPAATNVILLDEDKDKLTGKGRRLYQGEKRGGGLYHDAFLIHIHHYQLTIHTARFPTTYLEWIQDAAQGVELKGHFILHKVSKKYDLSIPGDRLEAAQALLILLVSLKIGGTSEKTSKVFVARAVTQQTIDTDLQSKPRKEKPGTKPSLNIEPEEEKKENSIDMGMLEEKEAEAEGCEHQGLLPGIPPINTVEEEEDYDEVIAALVKDL